MGVPSRTIGDWVAAGRLHRVFAGVFLVGHRLRVPFAREMAAVLAVGDDAVLSHRSAVELWRMLKPREGFHPQVTTRRRVQGPVGVRVHWTRSLRADEITDRDGIRVTAPMRALLDFAAQGEKREVERAYEEGLILERYDLPSLNAYLERSAGRHGIDLIKRLIERDLPPSVTIEEAHRRLLELIRASDLPHPRTEVWIGTYRVDILWPAEKLIVEMDGAAFHNLPSRIERDKRRDAELATLGYQVIRVTWRQLTGEPAAVIARIEATLAARLPA
jgi:very-short-patch-repair endonuclease